MARDTEKATIGSHDYRVTMLGAKEGRKLFFRLVKVTAPSLGELLKGAGTVKGDDLGTMKVDFIGEAIKQLASDLDEKLFDDVCIRMAAMTEFGSESQDRFQQLEQHFDNHFAGKYGEMMRWLKFALEVNFASFFSEFKKEVLDKLRKKEPVPSISPTTSTGPSTV